MKFAVIISLLVLAILGGLVGYRFYKIEGQKKIEKPRDQVAPVVVNLVKVVRGEIRDIGKFTGSLEANSYVIISSKASGRLEKIMVNIGDVVSHGQLIAVLDAEEQTQVLLQEEANLGVIKAELESAIAQEQLARRELDRYQKLRDDAIVSEADFDAVEHTHRVKQTQIAMINAQIQKQEAAIRGARTRLGYTQIVAKWDQGGGERLVAERFVDPGGTLAVNAPLISLVDISEMRAIFSAVETDYSRIYVGQPADVLVDAFPGEVFTGKIIRIAPILNEQSRQGRVEISVPNLAGRLKPGMFVRIQITFQVKSDRILLPLSAVVSRDERLGVFLARGSGDEMRGEFVPVELGIRVGETVELTSPEVLDGEVVTLGNHLLRDNSSIRLPRQFTKQKGE